MTIDRWLAPLQNHVWGQNMHKRQQHRSIDTHHYAEVARSNKRVQEYDDMTSQKMKQKLMIRVDKAK